MQTNLIELVASVLNVSPDSLTLDSGPRTVGQWDSLAHVTIVAAVEDVYGVQLSMPEILSIQSIAALDETLKRYGVTAAGEDRQA